MDNHYTRVENQILPVIGETAVMGLPHILWPFPEMPADMPADDLQLFLLQGACDVLKEVGPIPKEDYDYYENL